MVVGALLLAFLLQRGDLPAQLAFRDLLQSAIEARAYP